MSYKHWSSVGSDVLLITTFQRLNLFQFITWWTPPPSIHPLPSPSLPPSLRPSIHPSIRWKCDMKQQCCRSNLWLQRANASVSQFIMWQIPLLLISYLSPRLIYDLPRRCAARTGWSWFDEHSTILPSLSVIIHHVRFASSFTQLLFCFLSR